MTQEMMIMAAILVAVILFTFIGILSRYRKCKSDEVLVVYGKTGGDKKSAKLYHGGAAFVWPIIQGYEFLSMKPLQIDCKLTGALSAQNIRVDVPTTITVAISTDPEVMQNAAERMLGLTMDDKQNLITDVVYGQMRLVIADMTIEELNSDRDKFLSKVKDNIDTELRKFGLYLMNINISDIRDAANYIVNLGKEAESKALNEAQANIEEQETTEMPGGNRKKSLKVSTDRSYLPATASFLRVPTLLTKTVSTSPEPADWREHTTSPNAKTENRKISPH